MQRGLTATHMPCLITMDLLLWILVPLISLPLLLNQFSRRNLPPGPYPWPIKCNMMSVLSGAPHDELMKLARVHGPPCSSNSGCNRSSWHPPKSQRWRSCAPTTRSSPGVSSPKAAHERPHQTLGGVDGLQGRVEEPEVDRPDGALLHQDVRRAPACSAAQGAGDGGLHRRKGRWADQITEVVFGTSLNILGHAFSKFVFRYGEEGDKVGMRTGDTLVPSSSPSAEGQREFNA